MMKGIKWVLGWAVLGLTAWGADAGSGGEAPSGPRIRMAEMAHDFGRIDVGRVARHDFVFTNAGNAVLEILDVKPSCGCTTAGQWDKRVEPGQTGKIPLQFNSTGFSGAISKMATITCNDPAQPNLVLQLRATVWRPIEVNPPSAFFNVSSEAATDEVRVIRIVNHTEAPLVLSDLECTNKAFRAELATVKPDKEFEVRVSVNPPFTSTYVQGSISLKTTSTNLPVVNIPVYANVQPAVQAIPSQIYLPAGPLASAMQPSVTVRNTGTNALVITEPAINLAGAGVTVREVQAGKVYTLSLNIPAGTLLQPTQQVALTFKSNHPKYPTLRVPVFQQQAAPRPRPAASVSRLPGVEGVPPLLARPVGVSPPVPALPPTPTANR